VFRDLEEKIAKKNNDANHEDILAVMFKSFAISPAAANPKFARSR
jgi:hypothetical protein